MKQKPIELTPDMARLAQAIELAQKPRLYLATRNKMPKPASSTAVALALLKKLGKPIE